MHAWAAAAAASRLQLPLPPIDAQHRPVYTIGKRGKEADFRVPVQVGRFPNLPTSTES